MPGYRLAVPPQATVSEWADSEQGWCGEGSLVPCLPPPTVEAALREDAASPLSRSPAQPPLSATQAKRIAPALPSAASWNLSGTWCGQPQCACKPKSLK
jgi:hypothetical protein